MNSVTATLDLLPRLLASSDVGVAHLDEDLHLCSWNSAWAERVGITASSTGRLLGLPVSELLPNVALSIQSRMSQLLAGETLHLEQVALAGSEGTFYQDLILIPLVEDAGVTGFLSLLVEVSDRGTEREALERTVLTYRRELSALRDVMSVAAESLELRDVLNRLLDHVLRMMKSKVGAIHLFDEERTVLRLAASRRVRKRILAEIDEIAGPFHLEAWPTGESEPYVVPDIAEQLCRSVTDSMVEGHVAYVGVPVRSRGEILGLISVVGRAGREFDEGDIALLTSIADQIGVVVENARLHRQAEQLAVVRERERLARELHDSVTQSLYSLTLLAEASQRLLGSGDLDRAMEYTGRLGEIAQQALKEMRLLVYQLRPLVLKREGLVGALQQRLDAVEKRAGMDARLLVEGTLDLPAMVEEGLYRIAQEALNNALKHAAPRSVTLRIEADDRHVTLQVEDDGRGFEPAAVKGQGGMGLTSMEERAERLGGSFSLVSAPGHGTTVRVDVEVER